MSLFTQQARFEHPVVDHWIDRTKGSVFSDTEVNDVKMALGECIIVLCYSVLYWIELRCGVLYWIELNCGVSYWLHCTVLHCVVLYCIVLYCIVLYCIVWCCIALYCIVLYCIVLYCIVLYCTVLYCIVLYCILLYCIVFLTIALHRGHVDIRSIAILFCYCIIYL